MRNSEDMMASQGVLAPRLCAWAEPVPETSRHSAVCAKRPAPSGIRGIRMDRVEAARARLLAGEIPLSAEALADAILRHAHQVHLGRG